MQEYQENIINKIHNMSYEQMEKFWMAPPIGNVIFNSQLPYFEIFCQRFAALKGIKRTEQT